MINELESIIMLLHEDGEHLKETLDSILAQTYTNWELLFVDDNSNDGTITKMMELKGMYARFNITRSVYDKGTSYLRNKALRQARRKWIAFLNVGDVWEPTKLERQIAFMEEHGYAFSYTKFGLMNDNSGNRGIIIGGKEHINYKEMQKCC